MDRQLRPPSLGPIVGHTTAKTARIWIRGAEVDYQRTIGVAALGVAGEQFSQVKYFRLHREFDRTGCVEFDKLAPETQYTVRTGSLALDSTDADFLAEDEQVFDKLPKPQVWLDELGHLPEPQSEARFQTFPVSSDRIRFAFGSCRYPGFLWNTKRGDRIYKAICDRAAAKGQAAPLAFVLMVGDQIYADRANLLPLNKADTPAEFHERYSTAWGSPNMRRLMRLLPTYMILDDHEIEDNWERGRLNKDSKRVLFNMAIQYYQSYQWIHGPRTFGGKLYYTFESGGFPFFVIDTRTQRIRSDDLAANHLLGRPRKPGGDRIRGQLDELCNWLGQQQRKIGDRPKFIVSSNVFVPNPVDSLKHPEKSDSWPAFPETRRAVLEKIVTSNVNNVVFLSGDIHCSNVARITFEDNGQPLPLKAFAITSSAFYWPFPFADGDPNDYVHDSKKEGDGFDIKGKVVMHYQSFAFEQEDNFTEVDVRFNDDTSKGKIVSTVYNARGSSLKSTPLEL